MKIATWNVNSIRARLELVGNWLKENNIDVLLMQEIKCLDEQFPIEFFEEMGYNVEIFGQKALNGVAILTKYRPFDVKKDLPLYDFTDIYMESRYIEAKIEVNSKIFRIASIYFPNGSPLANYEGEPLKSPRFSHKLDFFDRFNRYITEEKEKNPDEIFILGGDYNIMHNEIDVHNPKLWYGEIAFTDVERAKMDALEASKLVDIFRHLHKDAKEFSWWNYRFGGFEKNHGLRIDYIYTHSDGLKLVKSCEIDKSTRALEKPSDHAPCVIDIAL
ncbi:exodeoxyribonuclease III [Candidatus Deianiraea vastatrix]|uniref:Exodeoxyribonuclease III n=1 Tax=Candidatus Deianiraea vastatrix TaxID=2163644 RepID=A0A5B8XD02_9RICK|nr:exodeoxyribonuclease III [Candidatus Deianiraea vastatrix]QED23183.1 Exodeoxyribonuclease III [Candidatus Deianiraea vastatrix]